MTTPKSANDIKICPVCNVVEIPVNVFMCSACSVKRIKDEWREWRRKEITITTIIFIIFVATIIGLYELIKGIFI